MNSEGDGRERRSGPGLRSVGPGGTHAAPPLPAPGALGGRRVAGASTGIEDDEWERRGEDCIREGEIDRLINGDVSPEVMARFEAHARDCASCLEDLAFFEQMRLEGLLEMPPVNAWEAARAEPSAESLAGGDTRALREPPRALRQAQPTQQKAVPERAGGEPGRKRPRALAGWALAATALVAAGIYLAAAPGSGESIDGTGLRAKGQDSPAQGDALRLAVTNGAQVRRFEPGERLETGDKVGFFYSAGSRGFLTIFNVDPLVGATLLFPTHGRSGWVEPGVDRPLGAGAALGPAPWASAEVQGCEWIVAIFTPDERAPKDLARYLRGPDETNDPCRLEPTVPSARSLFVVPIRR